MKKILAIDGGGIRGVIPAIILTELERRAGKPCSQLFDMLAGTSTGGIISVGLLSGTPASRLVELYINQGDQIFDGEDPLHGTIRPRYSAAPLEDILQRLLGSTWLSQTKGPELLVPSFCLNPRGAWFFKSWKARGTHLDANDKQDDYDFPLWQIARATSAAETYFPTAEIKNMSGTDYYMADGGTHCNNPAMAAFASALQLWPGEEVKILSLGTGTSASKPLNGPASQGWGAVEWATEGGIVDICMDGTSDVTDYELSCLGVDSVRLQPRLTSDSTRMDDASPENLSRLSAFARALIAARPADLDLFK